MHIELPEAAGKSHELGEGQVLVSKADYPEVNERGVNFRKGGVVELAAQVHPAHFGSHGSR